MLKSIISPLTTATSLGVAVRYIATIVTSIIAVLGVLGWLTPAQADALTKQVPELLAAVAAVVPIVITIYATVTKSSSDKAAEAAKKIDKQIPAGEIVVIAAPNTDQPPIVVPGK